MCIVPLARGFRHFVSLFNDGWQQRFVCLLAIPRTTARRAQLRDDFAKLFKRSHSERSAAESKDPLHYLWVSSRDSSTSLGMTVFKCATASGACRTLRSRQRNVC